MSRFGSGGIGGSPSYSMASESHIRNIAILTANSSMSAPYRLRWMISSFRSCSDLASAPALKSTVCNSTSSCIIPRRYAPEPQAGSTTVTSLSAAATRRAAATSMPSVRCPSTNAAIDSGAKPVP